MKKKTNKILGQFQNLLENFLSRRQKMLVLQFSYMEIIWLAFFDKIFFFVI